VKKNSFVLYSLNWAAQPWQETTKSAELLLLLLVVLLLRIENQDEFAD
jgi:hypothetical protein